MTGPSTPPTSSPDWERIARYLAGESAPAEAEAVRQWLEEHPSDARVIAALDAATRQHARTAAPTLDVEAALRRMKTRQPARSRFPRLWVGLAAAAAVATFAVLTRPTPVDTPPVATETFTTTLGTDTATLADGTRIILAPATQVAVNGDDITLSGEAFFTIADGSSYTIGANGTTVRDIGTAFGVQAYPNERVRVFVTSGIVEISRADRRVTLDSGDVGVVQPDGGVTRTADAVTADDLAWTRGRLLFRDASVAQVRADLRRWYGVELQVTDSTLLRRHFTGEALAGEPVARITDALALALGARAQRRGDTIVLSPRR